MGQPKLLQRLQACWPLFLGVFILIFQIDAYHNLSQALSKKMKRNKFHAIPVSSDNVSPQEDTYLDCESNHNNCEIKGSRGLGRSNQAKLCDTRKANKTTEDSSQCFVSKASFLSLNLSDEIDFNRTAIDMNSSNTDGLFEHTSQIENGLSTTSPLHTVSTEIFFESRISSVLTDHVWSENSSRFISSLIPYDEISCRGRCGGNMFYPCSCAEVCLVYGNCCTDIKEECPGVVSSGRSRFNKLLEVEVKCSSATDTFLVMSCPGLIDSGNNILRRNPTPSTAHTEGNGYNVTMTFQSEHQTVPSILSTKNVFLALLFDAPVSDVATQVIYKNRSIALCNGALPTDLLTWRTEIKLKNITKPSNLKEIDDITDETNHAYLAPATPNYSSAGSTCIARAIGKCKPEWISVFPQVDALCLQKETTYYTTKYVHKLKTYYFKNIYCFICNMGSVDRVKPILKDPNKGKHFGLSIVASFSSSGLLQISSKGTSYMLKWDAVDCSLSSIGQEDSPCRSTACKKDVEIKVGPACRKLIQIQFAIAYGNCIFTRPKVMESELLSLIKCYLEKYDKVVFSSKNARFDIVFDRALGLPLFRVTVKLYYLSLRYDVQRFKIWTELALLAHDANFCCEPVPANIECVGSSCRLGDLEVPAITSVKPSREVFTEEVPKDKLAIFCESNIYSNKKLITGLICHKVHAGKSQLDFFQEVAQVPCFKDDVGEKVLHKRARRACNSACLTATERFLILSSFLLLSLREPCPE